MPEKVPSQAWSSETLMQADAAVARQHVKVESPASKEAMAKELQETLA